LRLPQHQNGSTLHGHNQALINVVARGFVAGEVADVLRRVDQAELQALFGHGGLQPAQPPLELACWEFGCHDLPPYRAASGWGGGRSARRPARYGRSRRTPAMTLRSTTATPTPWPPPRDTRGRPAGSKMALSPNMARPPWTPTALLTARYTVFSRARCGK